MTFVRSGPVTFLSSAVERSTSLWDNGEGLLRAAVARHHQLLDGAIAAHGGVSAVGPGEGTGVMAAFVRPSDALAAALDAQRAMAREAGTQGVAPRVSVGLHTGEAQLRDDGHFLGRAVVRCAQLRAVAHGGQTVLSTATRDLVADRLVDGVTLRDLGVRRLKDLGPPERVWQLCHPELMNDFPSLRSLDSVPNNLPVQLTSFVGREAELREVRQALDEARLVTLTGAGGCGKTRLALHVAAEAAHRHLDGVRWVDLAPLSAGTRAAYAVARTFGLVEEEGRPLVETLCEQLSGCDALLVLDNCEHVIEPCAELAQALLRATPNLRILTTSREPLAVPGELTWRVPSLDDAAGVQLFFERAAHVRPGLIAEGSAIEAVSQICRRLDGLPLAIELAAARVRMMPVARIAAALDDRFRLLTCGGRTVLPRQQTLEESVAWSHDLLDDTEKALLRRLSVFVGGFTLEAAESVCAGADLDDYAVLEVLSRLVDKSLVQADLIQGEGRYRLLETIRFYARRQLTAARESDATRHGHRDYYLALAERAEPELVLANGPAWLDILERERDNLTAAAQWCEDTGAHELLLRLLTSLTMFFELRSHLPDGGRWFAKALRRHRASSTLRARALWGAAHVALYGGDFEALGRYAPQALAMAQDVGDEAAFCRALNINGMATAWLTPEVDRGLAMLERSIDLGRKLGDDWVLADGLKLSTFTLMLQGDYRTLGPRLSEFRTIAERLGNRFFMAWYHIAAGWMAIHRGEFAEAERELMVGLEEDRELGGAATAGVAVALLGEVEALTGRHAEAEARLGPFLGRASATGDYLGAPWGVPTLGRLLVGRGAAQQAREMMEPFVALLRPLGVPYHLSDGLGVLGAAYLDQGENRAAEAALTEARELARSIHNPWLAGRANDRLGQLARRCGETGRAEELHHEALACRAAADLRPGVAESLEALAGLAVDQERCADGARLFGAASALRAGMGLIRWPADQPGYDSDLGNARRALGDAAFDAAWGEGAALSVDGAVAYVSRARGERKRPTSGWESLTPTELEVVRLVAKGLTNPEIGERLFIGRGTVKTHVAHVFAKLGLRSRAELAAEATRRSL